MTENIFYFILWPYAYFPFVQSDQTQRLIQSFKLIFQDYRLRENNLVLQVEHAYGQVSQSDIIPSPLVLIPTKTQTHLTFTKLVHKLEALFPLLPMTNG
jgi:hypothetical protein